MHCKILLKLKSFCGPFIQTTALCPQKVAQAVAGLSIQTVRDIQMHSVWAISNAAVIQHLLQKATQNITVVQ